MLHQACSWRSGIHLLLVLVWLIDLFRTNYKAIRTHTQTKTHKHTQIHTQTHTHTHTHTITHTITNTNTNTNILVMFDSPTIAATFENCGTRFTTNLPMSPPNVNMEVSTRFARISLYTSWPMIVSQHTCRIGLTRSKREAVVEE